MPIKLPKMPTMPSALLRKGVVPAALLAALAAPLSYITLEKFEGNILYVYPDKLARNIPTFCAGRTDWKAPLYEKLTSDQCIEVNKATIAEYGYHMLGCTEWKNLTGRRLIALTMFAINVGKDGACGSGAVKAINAGNIEAGCMLISRRPDGTPNWSYADGKYVQGLFNRRWAETQLCLDPRPV